jgi:restriction system protein
MTAEGAANGFVVTSGEFTADAIEFASGRNIALVNGPKLFEMFDQVRARRQPATTAKPAVPSCPKCQKEMVQRTAKKGPNAGQAFWGCSGYPACFGTRAIA